MGALVSLILAAPWLGVVLDESSRACAQITAVVPGSPAHGVLSRGECIMSVNGRATRGAAAFIGEIRKLKVGDVVAVRLRSREVRLELANKPEDAENLACRAGAEVETTVQVVIGSRSQTHTLSGRVTVGALRQLVGAGQLEAHVFQNACGMAFELPAATDDVRIAGSGTIVFGAVRNRTTEDPAVLLERQERDEELYRSVRVK